MVFTRRGGVMERFMDAKIEKSAVPFVTLSLSELRSYAMPRAKDDAERARIEAAIVDREAAGVHPHATGSTLEWQLGVEG